MFVVYNGFFTWFFSILYLFASCDGCHAMLTQFGAPGRVTGWAKFSHWHSVRRFGRHFQCLTGFVFYLFCSI